MLRPNEKLWDGSFGNIHSHEHCINLTPERKLVRQLVYRSGRHERGFLQEEVAKMLRDGFIWPSKSECASQVVLAPKADAGLRLCVD